MVEVGRVQQELKVCSGSGKSVVGAGRVWWKFVECGWSKMSMIGVG